MAASRMRRLICTWIRAHALIDRRTGETVCVHPLFRFDVPEGWQVVCTPPKKSEHVIQFRVPQVAEAVVSISLETFLAEYDARTRRAARVEEWIQDWIISLVAHERRRELLSRADPDCGEGWLRWLQAYERDTIYGGSSTSFEENTGSNGNQHSWE